MEKKMKATTFVILLISAFLTAFCVLVGANVFATRMWNKNLRSDWKSGRILGSDAWTMMEYKTNYISQKNLPYNAFLFGGSKSSAMQPSELKVHTGYDFYNYWTNSGCFENYEMYIDYILKTYKDIKEIILCLSSHEVEHYDALRELVPSNIQNVPFAFAKVRLKFFKEKFLNISTFIDLYNSRNTENLHVLTRPDGSRDFSLFFAKREADPEKYIKRRVLRGEDWEESLHDLFYAEPQLSACDENIAALKRIKAKLDGRNIKLTVIIMPTFIGELCRYATPQFAQYLKDLVSVTDVWNFGGINDVDLNPYNFSDVGHCFDYVANKMIETVYSPTPNTSDMDAFGILLNKGNIEEYLETQKQKWLALKAEYDSNRTIALQGKNDQSYLGK